MIFLWTPIQIRILSCHVWFWEGRWCCLPCHWRQVNPETVVSRRALDVGCQWSSITQPTTSQQSGQVTSAGNSPLGFRLEMIFQWYFIWLSHGFPWFSMNFHGLPYGVPMVFPNIGIFRDLALISLLALPEGCPRRPCCSIPRSKRPRLFERRRGGPLGHRITGCRTLWWLGFVVWNAL